jgi:hypothetical protein
MSFTRRRPASLSAELSPLFFSHILKGFRGPQRTLMALGVGSSCVTRVLRFKRPEFAEGAAPLTAPRPSNTSGFFGRESAVAVRREASS